GSGGAAVRCVYLGRKNKVDEALARRNQDTLERRRKRTALRECLDAVTVALRAADDIDSLPVFARRAAAVAAAAVRGAPPSTAVDPGAADDPSDAATSAAANPMDATLDSLLAAGLGEPPSALFPLAPPTAELTDVARFMASTSIPNSDQGLPPPPPPPQPLRRPGASQYEERVLVEEYFRIDIIYLSYVHKRSFILGMDKALPFLKMAILAAGAMIPPKKLLPKKEGMWYYDTACKMYQEAIEYPSLECLQGLLILVMVSAATGNKIGAWQRLSLAADMVRLLRLDVDPDDLPPEEFTPKSWVEVETRRRCWWSCYLVDRAFSYMSFRPTLFEKDLNSVKPVCNEDMWISPKDPSTFEEVFALGPSLENNIAMYNIRVFEVFFSVNEVSKVAMGVSKMEEDELLRREDAVEAELAELLEILPECYQFTIERERAFELVSDPGWHRRFSLFCCMHGARSLLLRRRTLIAIRILSSSALAQNGGSGGRISPSTIDTDLLRPYVSGLFKCLSSALAMARAIAILQSVNAVLYSLPYLLLYFSMQGAVTLVLLDKLCDRILPGTEALLAGDDSLRELSDMVARLNTDGADVVELGDTGFRGFSTRPAPAAVQLPPSPPTPNDTPVVTDVQVSRWTDLYVSMFRRLGASNKMGDFLVLILDRLREMDFWFLENAHRDPALLLTLQQRLDTVRSCLPLRPQSDHLAAAAAAAAAANAASALGPADYGDDDDDCGGDDAGALLRRIAADSDDDPNALQRSLVIWGERFHYFTSQLKGVIETKKAVMQPLQPLPRPHPVAAAGAPRAFQSPDTPALSTPSSSTSAVSAAAAAATGLDYLAAPPTRPAPDAAALRAYYVGRPVDSVPKPALVLDVAKARRHCRAMLDAAAALGVGFRAHVKTHKTVELARLQVGDGDGGAGGPADFIASTPNEIDHLRPLLRELAAAGRRPSVLLGIPLPPSQAPRLAALARDIGAGGASLAVMLDHPDQLPALDALAAAAAASAGGGGGVGDRAPAVGVFVKVDAGYHRAGLPPRRLGKGGLLAALVDRHRNGRGVALLGVYSHSSLSYAGVGAAAALRALTAEIDACAAAIEENAAVLDVTAGGDDNDAPPLDLVVSVGASPQVVAVQHLAGPAAAAAEAALDADSARAAADLRRAIAALRDVGAAPAGRRRSLSARLELHAGVYPALDMQQLATRARPFATATQDDPAADVAVSVAAEVVSVYDAPQDRGSPEALVAAGTLALGREPAPDYAGWGVVVVPGGSAPEAHGGRRRKRRRLVVLRISQEHAVVGWEQQQQQGDEDGDASLPLPLPPLPLHVGQSVRILPNHSCIAAAMFGWFVVVDSDRQEDPDTIVDVWVRAPGW
ncbi:hypothetical protein HK405_004892, partial [Cladochytrium tenue]